MQQSFLPVDLHIHTVASGHAYSTLEEICKTAAAKGLRLIAVTDHGPAMPGGPHRYYFGNLGVLPARIEGVMILRGIEANIVNEEGEIDLPLNYLKKLDLVWAALHPPCIESGDRKQNTATLLKALENPYVDGIAHPCNPEYPIDAERVLNKAKEEGKLIEINNSSLFVRPGSWDYSMEIAVIARKLGNMVMVNSDAHFSGDVGNVESALEIIGEAGLPVEQLINKEPSRVLSFVKKRIQ